jgi:tRNA threonylcarbamoyladenosine biosynthesis protein TsaB
MVKIQPMNLLAFDTSTDVMSIAVQRGGDALQTVQTWQHTAAGGAQASTTLIPCIQRLMQQASLQFAELDAIAFGCGPGSFTGLRTACSVAQGLAFGAGVPVLPVDSLLAVAEEARHQQGLPAHFRVLAVLDARMDEVYAAYYEFNSELYIQVNGYNLISPEKLAVQDGWALAGNAFGAYGSRLPAGKAGPIHALPTASAMLRLAPALLAAGRAVPADQALPVYIRDKVAQTTQERAEQKRDKAPAGAVP